MDETATGIIRPDDRPPATELRHPESLQLDEMTTREILELLNAEDRRAVAAAEAALPQLAELVEEAARRVRDGGRVHYFGAGTSGRLAVLDAAELVPTFGIDPGLVRAHIAGGAVAVVDAVEGSEDSLGDGRREAETAVAAGDVVIGITSSGTTPYVKGALRAARERSALTALITSNPSSPLEELSDHTIVVDTGAEVLTGSTRLKAGTATKIVLNGFSTTLMIRLGRTYSNLMVTMRATNRKLRSRTLRILGEITGWDPDRTAELLDAAEGELVAAVVMAVADVSAERANASLRDANGSVRDAIRTLTGAE